MMVSTLWNIVYNTLNVAIYFLLQTEYQEMFMPKAGNFSYLHEK